MNDANLAERPGSFGNFSGAAIGSDYRSGVPRGIHESRMYTTLIDTDSLQTRISDPNVAIVDCRFDLSEPDWGQQAYKTAHIPGAVYAHLDHHLSGYTTGSN